MNAPVLPDQQELSYISCVRTLNATKRTFLEQWTIGVEEEEERERERVRELRAINT